MLLVTRHTQNIARYFCGFNSLLGSGVKTHSYFCRPISGGKGNVSYEAGNTYFIGNKARLKIMFM
jgi:hypothetical protein